MPTLNDAIDGLKAALATAAASAPSATASQTLSDLYGRRAAVVQAMQTAAIAADAERDALQAADAAATPLAERYHDEIGDVRTSISATLGAAFDAETDALRTALGYAATVATVDWFEPMRAAIAAVETAVKAEVRTATADLATKATAREAAAATLATRRAEMEVARRELAAHAAAAAETERRSRAALTGATNARTAGELFAAVVALDRATQLRDRLEEAVSLDPTAPGYDADNPTPATVTAEISAAWASARDAFETALADFIAAEAALLGARLAVETARIAAVGRAAARDADARAAAEAAKPVI